MNSFELHLCSKSVPSLLSRTKLIKLTVMGCDFASLSMGKPTPVVIRGILTALHVRSDLLPTKRSLFSHSISYRSFLSAVLRTVEVVPIEQFSHEINPPNRLRKSQAASDSLLLIRKLKWYSEMLRNCANDLCLRDGKLIHGQIIRTGIELDLHLWVSLINFYAKCGALGICRHVFDQMPHRDDVVSWTALISGFVARGYGDESIQLFREMRKEDVRPNEFTLATVLKGCSMSSDLEFGKQLHAEVVKVGVSSDVYIGSTLVDLYSKFGEVEYAESIFYMMPEKNAVLWNTLLNGYAQMGNGDAALRLFCKMSEPEMRFSNYTLSIVLKGVASSGYVRNGQAIHSLVIKIGDDLDNFVSCSLVNMYSKCGLAIEAHNVFKRIKEPDTVAWSSIISVLNQQGETEKAAKLFHSMRRSGIRPNQFTLASLVSAATDLEDPHYGQSIHALAYKIGFESDELVSNALIAMYMKFGFIYNGYHIFSKMTNQDLVSWNALLSGFHDTENSYQGIVIFRQMLTEGFKPNMYTFISILRSCSSLSDVEFGKQVHSHVIKGDLESDSYVETALIDMYAKCGFMEDVETIFTRLSKKDIFPYTVIISAYSQCNQEEKAARFFNEMRREGINLNEFALGSSLKCSSGMASLDHGRQLHSLAIKAGHSTDMFVASALVDMYGKCGQIDDAETVFNFMQSHDTVLWNTIICRYSQHGKGDKALQAFNTMVSRNVLPDSVTFIGVLSACSHMGLVEEGKKFFRSMSELYGIVPCVEHYACMVDIFGRCGKFDEIEMLINDMEVMPNALIWENVLAACRVHENMELGEKVAEKLFSIEPETGSNYVLLSNLYASKGRWDDVSRIRVSMSSKGVKKEPGCSWIEFDGQVHVFLSQDSSHPRLLDIQNKLRDLRERLEEAGYEPNTKYVLHNVSDKEKRENIYRHSERLALGFALISKIKSDKIRIFKNLRICGDCHDFMKFVSSIMDREIIVRDANRFHHFHHGMCSCKDYW